MKARWPYVVLSVLCCIAPYAAEQAPENVDQAALNAEVKKDVAEVERLSLSVRSSESFFKNASVDQVARWRATAELGCPEGQTLLGLAQLEGCGVPRDESAAYFLLQAAADQGLPLAQWYLAMLYLGGTSGAKDTQEAERLLRLAADQGYVNAWVTLGTLYAAGEDFPRDYAQAIVWQRKAADAGSPLGMVGLAGSYVRGLGIEKNVAEGLRLARAAAEMGCAAAQAALGDMYAAGQYVPQDKLEAARWYTLAADQGYESARHDLAALYLELSEYWMNPPAPSAEPAAAVVPDVSQGSSRPENVVDSSGFVLGDVQEVALGGGETLQLVWIPPGTFQMGSPEWEAGRDSGETRHPVTISTGFWIAKHEITVGAFARFVEETGYRTTAEIQGWGSADSDGDATTEPLADINWCSPGFAQGIDHPVVLVSWHDAQRFCLWLSRKTGRLFRLPTGAEWEYACRAGTPTARFTGDSDASLKGHANVPDLTKALVLPGECFNWEDGYPCTSPSGTFGGNPWGLCDMIGNVREWCQDCDRSNPAEPETDPRGDTRNCSRMTRGGSWYALPSSCRSSYSYGYSADIAKNDVGFRVVQTLRNPAE